MRTRRARRRPAVLVPAAALAFLAPLGGAAAQEASPAAGVPPPACAAEPRPVDEVVALFFGPGGEPLATPPPADPVASEADLPPGGPADPATAASIDATLREWLACFPAGQYARGFALMTDEAARGFGPDLADPSEDTAEEVRALLAGQAAGTPVPGEGAGATGPAIEGPRGARLLGDGRAGAVWSVGGDAVFLLFAERGGRWLIDGFVDVEEDVAATPGA
jgi:hypothetical protein